jgi:sugar phosphate isomerase/epimerase
VIRPHVHIPFDKIGQYLDFILKHSLDLEIYFSSAVLDTISVKSIDSISKTLEHKPSLSIHAPFMDLSPGAVDSKIREATIARFNHILDISGVLRPKAIVFHSGYEKWKYALDKDLWLEKSLMTWRPLNARAEAMGVKIAIENIFEDEPANLVMLMEAMGSVNFGICFDTGHFNLFSKVPLEIWMSSLNPYIIELHLHDNDRTSDQHLPISQGTFDFRGFFGLLGDRDCVYTLEAHSTESVLKSMKALGVFTGS